MIGLNAKLSRAELDGCDRNGTWMLIPAGQVIPYKAALLTKRKKKSEERKMETAAIFCIRYELGKICLLMLAGQDNMCEIVDLAGSL